MSKVTLIGLDLAKSIFHVHGVDAEGNTVLRKRLRWGQMAAFFARLEPCVVAMEACGGSHYWGWKLADLGHTPRLISPQYVKPFVKTNKNDAAAIATVARQPEMLVVSIKSAEQQAVLSIHRTRAGLVKSWTALCSQIRGLLTEFGLVLPAHYR